MSETIYRSIGNDSEAKTFDVLLTVQLSMILVINQLNAQNLAL